jgi:hypothetical protein
MKDKNFKWAVLGVSAFLLFFTLTVFAFKIRAVKTPTDQITTLNTPIEISTERNKDGKLRLVVKTPKPKEDCAPCEIARRQRERSTAKQMSELKWADGNKTVIEQVKPTNPGWQCRSIDCIKHPEECAKALGIKKESL